MRHAILLAFVAGAPAFAQAPTAPTCASVGTWSYAGTGNGSVAVNAADKSTSLAFAPGKKDKGADVAFTMTVAAGAPGVYQLNADFDVKHLSDDGLFTLIGATSAIPGRDFDVKVAKGDDGSSSFSRPVTTTGRPFQVEFHTHGAVSMTVRNVKTCRLR